MEKEKKNGGKFLLGIVLGLLVGACCSFGYFKFVNPQIVETTKTSSDKEEKKENATKECPKVYDSYDEVAISNIEKFMHADGYFCGTQDSFFKDTKVTAADISNSQAYLTVAQKYYENKETISKEQIESDIAALFGKDYKYAGSDDFGPGKICTSHYYDSATGNYPYQETACGGTCGPSNPKYYISKAVLDDGILTINLKVLFQDGDEGVYFSDPAKTQKINEYSEMKIIQKGKSYRFTLKEENGNYVFVSSEPIN